ncbi:ABC-three component system protein [Niabella beijingensis]|uniref:ABC-three component system protein n=1 Tax=Niabella beijingensis TaxID=2872700 RepID=UPI001CBAE580|nr:ABC-three component system protein [Niabella beijingensis]MBZ4191561.1 hypothetical protein [Niabella beijingensis]
MFVTLTADDLYIARKLFQLEIYKRNGQSYEDFFSKIMRLHNIDFIQIKPQGQFGDRKNDGFIKSTGQYYQVYAPENLSHKEKDTIEKLVTDFNGLYAYWNATVTPILEFNFVLNDKYQGTYPSLHPELTKIEGNHAGVKCKPFLSQHLEDIFLKLPHSNIEDVLGKIPTAEDISLNVSNLNEVIEYLISLKDGASPENFPVNPDFEEKIVFNSLSSPAATFLRYGSYQDGALKDFFKVNSTFAKDDLKNTFSKLYKDAVQEIPDSDSKNDLVFFDIAKKAYPKQGKVYQDAVFVLMAYFFSYCDIFEEPPLKQQQTLFQ